MSRWALAALVLLGCGEDGPPPDLIADVTRIQELIDQDPALEPIDAADAISDDRPVHAARLLRTSALPAAEQQVEAFDGLEMGTSRGRSYARRTLRAYRARLSALQGYHAVLEQGVQADPAELLDAIRARREAEVELLDVISDMGEISPTADRRRPPANPSADEEPEGAPGAAEGLTPSPSQPTPAP